MFDQKCMIDNNKCMSNPLLVKIIGQNKTDTLELFYLRHRFILALSIIGLIVLILLAGSVATAFTLKYINRAKVKISSSISQDIKLLESKNAYKISSNSTTSLINNTTRIGILDIILDDNSKNKMFWTKLEDEQGSLLAITPVFNNIDSYTQNNGLLEYIGLLEPKYTYNNQFSLANNYKSAALFSPYFAFLNDVNKSKIFSLFTENNDLLEYSKSHSFEEIFTSEYYINWLEKQVQKSEISAIISQQLDENATKEIPGFDTKSVSYDNQFSIDSLLPKNQDLDNKWGFKLVYKDKFPKIINRALPWYNLNIIQKREFENFKKVSLLGIKNVQVNNQIRPIDLKKDIQTKDYDKLENFDVNNLIVGEYVIYPALSNPDQVTNNIKDYVSLLIKSNNGINSQINIENLYKQIDIKTLNTDCSASCFLQTDRGVYYNSVLNNFWFPQFKNRVIFNDYRSSSPQVAFLSLIKKPYEIVGDLNVNNYLNSYKFEESKLNLKYDGSYRATNSGAQITLDKNNLKITISSANIDKNNQDIYCSNDLILKSIDNSTYYIDSFETKQIFIKSGNDKYLKGEGIGKLDTKGVIKTTKDQANTYKNCFYDQDLGSNYQDRKLNIKSERLVGGEKLTEEDKIEAIRVISTLQIDAPTN
jgi:hypothetical protein